MKKIFIFLFTIFLLSTSEIQGKLRDYYSQTFMFTRPAYFNAAAYQAIWNNIAYCDESKTGAFQILTFIQKSSNDPFTKTNKKISEYFLIKNNPVILVKGDDSPICRDVRAEWIGLPSDFIGKFSLFPKQKQIAFYLDAKQNIEGVLPCSFFDNVWVGASLIVGLIENKLDLHQETIRSSNNQTIIQALNSPNYLYAKLCKKQKTFGLSEFRVKAGTKFPITHDLQLNVQSYISFPLASKQTPEYVYNPFRGFNGHFGLGTIMNMQFPINNKCDPYSINICLDIENLFLFKNRQCRTLDLFGKPWSRYLLLSDINGNTNIPAINVLTQKVKVKAFDFVDISVGVRFIKENFQADLTYGFFGHGSEELILEKPFNQIYGISARPGEVTPDGLPATASNSTIAFQAPVDKDFFGNNIFVPIREKDLNLKTGAARAAITNRVNMSIGYILKRNTFDGALSAGGFVELPQNNAALKQWGMWFKIASAF